MIDNLELYEERKNAVNSYIRSLISADMYAEYETSGCYNTGSGMLNRGAIHLQDHGFLTEQQHSRLKSTLTSGALNQHLENDPLAKQHGTFFVYRNDKL